MKLRERTSGRKLSTLVSIGLIMVFVPVNTALVMFIYSLFRSSEFKVISSIEGPSTVYLESILPESLYWIGPAVFICGLIILGYAGIRRFLHKTQGDER
jgi:hypothetical protein